MTYEKVKPGDFVAVCAVEIALKKGDVRELANKRIHVLAQVKVEG